MIQLFTKKGRQEIKVWWHKPASTFERVLAGLYGAVLFFFIGILVRVFGYDAPIPLLPLSDLAYTLLSWALPFAFIGTLLGLIFPKAMLIISYFTPVPGGGDVSIS